MRALIKNSKRILLNQVDPSERALIEEFISESTKEVTTIRSLFDIDNELDGVSFELTGQKEGQINYRKPCIQILIVEGSTTLDLCLDEETNIRLDNHDCEDYLETSLEGKLIHIRALTVQGTMGTTGQYILKAILTKENYDPVVVPINISVLYFLGTGTRDYEQLYNQPKINNKVLVGDRTLDELGIQGIIEPITNAEIDEMLSDREVENNG